MNIQTYRVGSMQANCYLLTQEQDAVIIDPGDDADFLLEEISRRNLRVHALITTHGHFDHLMAAGELQMALQTPFFLHPKDTFLLARVEETARHFLGFEPYVVKPQQISHIPLGSWSAGPFTWEVIHTPGHTPGSVCLFSKSDGYVIVGDLLFAGGGIGRYDFAYSDKDQLFRSIQKVATQLPGETRLYSGHGDESILEDEVQLLKLQGIIPASH